MRMYVCKCVLVRVRVYVCVCVFVFEKEIVSEEREIGNLFTMLVMDREQKLFFSCS